MTLAFAGVLEFMLVGAAAVVVVVDCGGCKGDGCGCGAACCGCC